MLGIQVVPAIMVIDGKSLIDGKDITREEFYRQLPSMKSPPTTATPSSTIFEDTYQRLFQNGVTRIISIHAASTLSGLYNSAMIAAKRFSKNVTVIDSGLLSLGLGFQAIVAAETALRKKSLDDILKTIDDIRQRTHLIAMLDTLEYVRRSGRVSWARASLGTIFQVKPFIGLKDGDLIRLGEARTRRNGVSRLYGFLKKLGSLERLAILHTNAEVDAQLMVDEFATHVKNQPLMVNVTTVIGTHVGPQGLGFVAIVE